MKNHDLGWDENDKDFPCYTELDDDVFYEKFDRMAESVLSAFKNYVELIDEMSYRQFVLEEFSLSQKMVLLLQMMDSYIWRCRFSVIDIRTEITNKFIQRFTELSKERRIKQLSLYGLKMKAAIEKNEEQFTFTKFILNRPSMFSQESFKDMNTKEDIARRLGYLLEAGVTDIKESMGLLNFSEEKIKIIKTIALESFDSLEPFMEKYSPYLLGECIINILEMLHSSLFKDANFAFVNELYNYLSTDEFAKSISQDIQELCFRNNKKELSVELCEKRIIEIKSSMTNKIETLYIRNSNDNPTLVHNINIEGVTEEQLKKLFEKIGFLKIYGNFKESFEDNKSEINNEDVNNKDILDLIKKMKANVTINNNFYAGSQNIENLSNQTNHYKE